MSFDIAHVKEDRYVPPTPPNQGLAEAFLKYDDEIAREIRAYTKYIGGAALAEFRELDLSKKVDKMCFVYGSGDYMRDKSIKLKALNILKGFGDYMFHGDHAVPRSYSYSYDDENYWDAVETELEGHLHELAIENGGNELTTGQFEGTNDPDRTVTEYSWQVLGFSVNKFVKYFGNSPHDVRYEISRLQEEA